jgi:predicted PhzF superfamily epimerase YddE/YHI9
MFAPNLGVLEDPVCGSAHCLVIPYWKKKKNLSGVIPAKQVSARGGNLAVTVDEAKGIVRMTGQLRMTFNGNVFV